MTDDNAEKQPINQEQEEPKRKRRNRRKKKRRKISVAPMPEYALPDSAEAVNLMSCARCSFFIAGYRVEYGLDKMKAAFAEQVQDGWLVLEGNWSIRHLLYKSYGYRLDLEAFFYTGVCKACQRMYTYQVGDAEQSDVLKIEVSPGLGATADDLE